MTTLRTIINDTTTGTNTYKTNIPVGDLVDVSTGQTLTNKILDGSSNTFSAIPQSAISGMPVGTIVGTNDVQTLTNKSLEDLTTFIVDNTTPSKKLQFDCSAITASTTRTVTAPNRDGIAVLSNLDMPITLTAPINNAQLYFNNGVWTELFQLYGSWAFEGNATSSGGTLNQWNWVQGTFSNSATVGGLATGSNNSFVYSDPLTKMFKVTYCATPITSSNDRTAQIKFWKNGSAITNPSGASIVGSRSTSILRTSINDTRGMAGVFTISLAQNDNIRAYIANTENNDAITVSDFSVVIEPL